MEIADVDYDKAGEVLELAQGHVKTALMMLLADIDAETAREKLQDADGFIKTALQG
jgi:N-acetylmuramic acid 6-phosphate etherase